MKKNAGLTVPFAFVIAVVVAAVILMVARSLNSRAHEMVYFNAMDRAYRLAETGLNRALGALAVDPEANINGLVGTVENEEGEYQQWVSRSDVPVVGGYYVVVSATRTVRGRTVACRLHTYALVSNVGDYFAAVSNKLVVSRGMQAVTGKIYSPNLQFIVTSPPDTQTQLQNAAYTITCVPPTPWDNATKAIVNISGDPGNQPQRLATPIIFPQVLDADLARYLSIAGPHTARNVFSGQIYPPGFAEFSGTAPPGDTYPLHTPDNHQHVYFYNGDMHIQGAVHGQVLFVATGDIYISNNLNISSHTDPSDFPGYTSGDSSSTAHQAVLITRHNVIIDNTFYTGPSNPVAVSTETIEALIMAPHGDLSAKHYASDDIHKKLSLNFNGALILGTWRDTSPDNFPSVFRYNRSYRYMDSLKTNPPPYLPALAQIVYSLEESVGLSGIYDSGGH